MRCAASASATTALVAAPGRSGEKTAPTFPRIAGFARARYGDHALAGDR
jgi:hypothetical protein